MMHRLAVLVVLTCVIVGCVGPTQYGEMNATGGASALPLGGDRFKIEARGNGATPAQTVNMFAYLKAAEATKSIGATHFIILDIEDKSTVTTGSFGPTATTKFNGNTAHTTVNEHRYKIPKAGRDFTIQAYRSNPPPGAIEADLTIQQTRALLNI